MKLSISRFQITSQQYSLIHDLIYYGSRPTAQHCYEFNAPVYDEDAGVYTDHGQNAANRTWANSHLMALLKHAVLDVIPIDEIHQTVELHVLSHTIGALVQLLHTVATNDDLQAKIWMAYATDLWESDGHYDQGWSRTGWIETQVAHRWIAYRDAKSLTDQLMAYRPSQEYRTKIEIRSAA